MSADRITYYDDGSFNLKFTHSSSNGEKKDDQAPKKEEPETTRGPEGLPILNGEPRPFPPNGGQS